jgi:Sel1 repeat
MRVGEFPFVFLSYDEPWADAFFDRLRTTVPGALRVHGVKGLDACHKAAARAAASRWFVTVDADTEVDPAFLSVEVPQEILNDRCRVEWASRNQVNGLTYGNGGLKLWPTKLVDDLRSHEAAPPGITSVDHDHARSPSQQNRVVMPGCYSVVRPAETAFHAFRCGFREGARLGVGERPVTKPSEFLPAIGAWRARHLRVWCTIGAHEPRGLWMIYGARLGLWMVQATDWDLRRINDYAWFNSLWADMIVPRLSPGGATCPTGFTWDHQRLQAEVSALGARLRDLLDLELPDLSPELSRFLTRQITPPLSPAQIDTLGHMYLKGKGVTRDPKRARALFETGLMMNLSSAINNLARMHELGQDGPEDPDRALELYEYATSLGNRHAPHHLARLLLAQADAAPATTERAKSLIRLAAERGFAPEQGLVP